MNLATWYQRILRMYSGVPYRLFAGGRAFPPLHYYLEVTRRCNLRCSMCQYIKWLTETPGADQKAGELTTDEWRDVIAQTNRFALITFTGGEPWLRKDFDELLAYACARRMSHVISNCTLLDEDRARRCVDLAPKGLPTRGLLMVGASIDAPGERHDAIRGQAGVFDKATRGIRALTACRDERGMRWPRVHVTSVIMQANLDALPEMPGLVRDLGGDVLNLATEIRYHDIPGVTDAGPEAVAASDIPFPRIDPHALRNALEATKRAANAARIDLRLPRMPVDEVVRYYSTGMDLARLECRMPWTSLFIGRKGDVSPCFVKKVGQVREARLKALWNGPEMRAFRHQCRKGLWPVCQGCCELESRE